MGADDIFDVVYRIHGNTVTKWIGGEKRNVYMLSASGCSCPAADPCKHSRMLKGTYSFEKSDAETVNEVIQQVCRLLQVPPPHSPLPELRQITLEKKGSYSPVIIGIRDGFTVYLTFPE